MLLHEIKTKNVRVRRKPRIGRGGKRGYSSGRGQKGQGSRAGHRIRPAERDFIIRLPKLRGYKNKPLSVPNTVIGLEDLETLKDLKVTREALFAAGLIKDAKLPVKILSNGIVSRAFEIAKDKDIKLSASAKEKILQAGGKVA